MDCKTCRVQEFLHKDLYCQGCPKKPKPKIVKGRAYLYRKISANAICSADVKAPKGMEIEASVVELLKQFRVEFVEDC